MVFVFFNFLDGGFMKNEYGKENEYSKGKNYQGYQGEKNKGYQAGANKPDNNYRNPNAPTQGGFSTPGGGQGQLNKTKNPQGNKPNQPKWGTGSINDKSDKDRR
jgi:hypothetical protein